MVVKKETLKAKKVFNFISLSRSNLQKCNWVESRGEKQINGKIGFLDNGPEEEEEQEKRRIDSSILGFWDWNREREREREA